LNVEAELHVATHAVVTKNKVYIGSV